MSAAPVAVVVTHIDRSLKRGWADPDELMRERSAEAFYEPAWSWVLMTTEELLEQEGQPSVGSQAFSAFVLRMFGAATWAARDQAGLREKDTLSLSWSLFKDTTKHRARFLFWALDEQQPLNDRVAPLRRGAAMLHELGALVHRFALVTDLAAGHRLARIRRHEPGEEPRTAAELGTPPPALARQGRMSPAGIAVFYGADEVRTALAEAIDPQVRAATAATFETLAPARIVDLSRIPPVPSLFDETCEALVQRPGLAFLSAFHLDVRAKVAHDDRVHIDYVPTQVVGEYLRLLFRDEDGRPIDGVAWRSAQDPERRSMALFVGAEACVDAREPVPDDGRLRLRLVGRDPVEL